MLAPAAGAGAAANASVGGPGPTGPPKIVEMYTYGGGLIGIQWTNGDSAASTQIGLDETAPFGDDVNHFPPTQAPGVTTFETGTSITEGWFARHIRNGQVTAWVEAEE
jgi:hypothetical protein